MSSDTDEIDVLPVIGSSLRGFAKFSFCTLSLAALGIMAGAQWWMVYYVKQLADAEL